MVILYLIIPICILTSTVSGRPYDDDQDVCEGYPHGSRVPDPQSCDGFYLCREGLPPNFGKCPQGLWFDPETQLCDYPENVTCELEGETTLESTTELETTTEAETTTTEVETTTTEAETTTTEAETSTTEAETSTTVAETTITESEDTTTEAESTTTPTTTTLSTSSPTFTTNTAPGIHITEGTVEPGIECSEFDKGKVIFLASKIDCEMYYLCYQGKPVPLHCITGHHWNQLEYFCDDPFYAHCQAEGHVDPNPYPDCPRRGRVFVPHRTECQFYVFCNEGVGKLNRCPHYYGWDMHLKTCVLLSHARCYVHNGQ